MAGEVKSRKITKRFLSFWRSLIFISTFTLILVGCSNPKQGDFGPTVSPEQKKVELQKSLERKFENPRAHYLLGQLYHAERMWDDAEYHYNNSLRFDPVYRPAQAAMIKLLLDRGDTVKAANYLDSYMNQAAGSPGKLLELALEFQQQQLDTYALSCFQQALDLAPNSANIHKHLGYFYLSRDDKVKAREHFEISFNNDRNQPDVSRELGKLSVPVVYEPKPGTTAGIE